MFRRVFIFLLFAGSMRAEIETTSAATRFRENLSKLAKDAGLSVGIAIKDLRTGEEFLVNEDTEFPIGSCIRIHLVSELFRQAAAKKLSVDEVRPLPDSARARGFGVLRYMSSGTVSMSLRDYAVLMVMVNDNTATNLLSDVLGLENVNASLAGQGTPELKFIRRSGQPPESGPRGPENVGTPRSAMRALELIQQGRVVDRATSDRIVEVLSVPEISYFRRGLPAGTRFAGRSGSGPSFRSDQGIVLLEDRPYVFCVMLKGLASGRGDRSLSAKADSLISSVSLLAIAYFSKPGAAGTLPTSLP